MNQGNIRSFDIIVTIFWNSGKDGLTLFSDKLVRNVA